MLARWRSSGKNKIKTVYQLHFQVTQVPRSKKSTLTISLLPENMGKPTVKLEKAIIQDGTCTWENPVYETVKLIRDPKTGKFNENIYHFIVASGSSKAGFLGEASVDFADFAVETEPLTVSLPLKFANSGAVLHVTIQRMSGDADQRDVEENEALSIPHNGSFKLATVSSNALASIWDVSSEDNAHDIGAENNTVNEDPARILAPLRQNSMPQKGLLDAKTAQHKVHRRSDTDWSLGSASNGSLIDSISSLEDNHPREQLHEASNDSVDKLKSEIANLMRQAELSELELESLRKQIIKESIRGQKLSTQVMCLTVERDELKTDCEKLKSLHKCNNEESTPKQVQVEIELEETRRELSYEKELNINLKLQLQKTQDSNSELILAVRDLNDMLEVKSRELSNLSSEISKLKNAEEDSLFSITELESRVKDLENQLEKQAQGFEDDLEAMTCSKVEQEQRAIRAEEALRKSRWNNANTAERLQEEFRRLSVEMTNKFDENEKLAMRSVSEANELRSEKRILEEMLERANEELEQIKERNGIDLQELLNQIDLKAKEMEEMSLELDRKSEKLEFAQKHEQEMHEASLMEIQTLRAEIERLRRENDGLSEQMNASIGETQMLLQRCNVDKDDLEKKISSAKMEVEKLHEELTDMRSLKDEKETMARNMLSEVQRLKAKYNELQDHLVEEEKERDNMRKQVVELKGELQKKEEEITNIEKKLNHKSGQGKFSNKNMTSGKRESAAHPPESVVITDLKKKIKFLEEQIKVKEAALEISSNSSIEKERSHNSMIEELKSSMEQLKHTKSVDEFNLGNFLSAVTLLNESNRSMERELKELQERYSEISLKFAEVEGERQQLVMTVRNLKNGKKS